MRDNLAFGKCVLRRCETGKLSGKKLTLVTLWQIGHRVRKNNPAQEDGNGASYPKGKRR